MFIPTHESVLDMSPTDFEKYSLQILLQQVKHLSDCKVQHNKIIEVDDGNYQIDGYIEFKLMGVTYKTIVECKHYKSSIPREKVQILYDKIRACGTNKGILISSSNFQSGAIEYASKHGIALIQLTDAGEQYVKRSQFNVITNSHQIPYNNGCPYIGVMQSSTGIGINCSYLSRTNLSLKAYLENIK
ncbi:restriction endonuclease [Clostridium aciditolerans]|uniref:Restriction endonuclease n=1 Tax=Clostridium aciditolerans TaxID=339861 RepID=A0A934M6X2_9CLOT|nr:restriction endonuclease [Clostridium aciditolerans]MBI6873436.1 restriction endonuclease [Clostridium aciditolerans]